MSRFVLPSKNASDIEPLGSAQLPSSEFVPLEMAHLFRTFDHVSGPESTTEKTTEKNLTSITKNPYITQSELAKVCGITVDGILEY